MVRTYLLDLSSGTEGGEGGQSGGGLGARLERRVHYERELGHLLHAVAASHDKRGHRGGGERRSHGVTLLVHVDVAVPDRARGGGSEVCVWGESGGMTAVVGNSCQISLLRGRACSRHPRHCRAYMRFSGMENNRKVTAVQYNGSRLVRTTTAGTSTAPCVPIFSTAALHNRLFHRRWV